MITRRGLLSPIIVCRQDARERNQQVCAASCIASSTHLAVIAYHHAAVLCNWHCFRAWASQATDVCNKKLCAASTRLVGSHLGRLEHVWAARRLCAHLRACAQYPMCAYGYLRWCSKPPMLFTKLASSTHGGVLQLFARFLRPFAQQRGHG